MELSSRLSASLLPVGAEVIAVRNFGPIQEGAPGIITGTADYPFLFWSRPMYLCTFHGNLKIAAKPKEVEAFKHGYTLATLEKSDPSFTDIRPLNPK